MSGPVPSKDRLPDLPSELRRFAKGCASGYWTGVFIEAAQALERPAHEREPPHCCSCSCGMTVPEPAVTLTLLRQLAEEYIETLGQYPVEGYATPREYAGSELSRFFAWLRMSSGFAVRAAQPPRDGQ